MFCKYCGIQLNEGTRFCHKCGKQVVSGPALGKESARRGNSVRQEYNEPRRTISANGMDSFFEQYPGLKYVVIVLICFALGGCIAGIILHIGHTEKEKNTEASITEGTPPEEYQSQAEQGYSQDYSDAEQGNEDWDDEPANGSEASPVKKEPANETIVFGETEEEPEQAEEEATEEESEFILPESSSRFLSNSDLEGLSEEECRMARNEIYARHGRRFRDEGIQAYFDAKDWYNGSISPDDFKEDMLSDLEKANRDLIVEYEKDHGYNQR